MGFFSGSDSAGDEEPTGGRPGDDVEQAESLARIEAGGIPVAAERRLRRLSSGGSLFTSGLSVSEFSLLEGLGQRPLAQVLGASVHQVGWQYLPPLPPLLNPAWGVGAGAAVGPAAPVGPPAAQARSYLWQETLICELESISRSWDLARRRAFDRLTAEALAVGGEAVIGVRLQRGEHDLTQGTVDYVVSGTAIRPTASRSSSWPVLSDLSVQDYWRLTQAGYRPLGLAATTAVIFVSTARATRLQRLRTVAVNQELEELSRAVFAARDTVRARLRGQVDANNGEGVVGVEFTHRQHRDKFRLESSAPAAATAAWRTGALGLPSYEAGGSDIEREGWVITMHAAGTVIGDSVEVTRYPPETVVRLGL